MINMKKLISEKGIAAIEFALVLPVLIMLVFGIIEFSLLLYDKQVITNASREGARFGIVLLDPDNPGERRSDGEITSVVNTYCSTYLISFGSPSPPTTSITRAGTGFGDDLTVSVAYKYNFLLLPNFVAGLAGGKNLNATTVMKME